MAKMAKQVRVFYAYPDHPPNVGETLQSTVRKIKASGQLAKNIRFTTWTDNKVSGQRLIATITGQIDRSGVFACDLTYPNQNVNFELGYALSTFKRIFASLNPSVDNAANEFARIYFSLLNMGYSQYANHEDLAEALLLEKPWETLQQTLLDVRHRQQPPRLEKPTLMYIKPPLLSDSVIAVQEEFGKTIFRDSIITDDPNEYSSQIVDWYAEKLRTADAVIVHLLGTDHSRYRLHNLKASMIAGLACGFGRPTLMLAHAPYDPPIDYSHLLQVHNTAEECVAGAGAWLRETAANIDFLVTRGFRVGTGE